MFRTFLAAAILAGVPALAQAQSVAAPLVVTATVVSSCKVEVDRKTVGAFVSKLPVVVTCARRSAASPAPMPGAPRRSEVRDALLVIDF